jgi:hypothetical protein
MQAACNEGESSILQQNVALLFAASGDMRNVVKTAVGMPEAYSAQCSIVINDKNFVIAARNAMLLLTALHFEPATAAPIMLHLWYSAMLPEEMIAALQEVVLPCVVDVYEKIMNKSEESFHAKTFKFGDSSVRLIFKKYEWFELGRMFLVPEGFTASQAQIVRRKVTLARKDHVDRAIFQNAAWLTRWYNEFSRRGYPAAFWCVLHCILCSKPVSRPYKQEGYKHTDLDKELSFKSANGL